MPILTLHANTVGKLLISPFQWCYFIQHANWCQAKIQYIIPSLLFPGIQYLILNKFALDSSLPFCQSANLISRKDRFGCFRLNLAHLGKRVKKQQKCCYAGNHKNWHQINAKSGYFDLGITSNEYLFSDCTDLMTMVVEDLDLIWTTRTS